MYIQTSHFVSFLLTIYTSECVLWCVNITTVKNGYGIEAVTTLFDFLVILFVL